MSGSRRHQPRLCASERRAGALRLLAQGKARHFEGLGVDIDAERLGQAKLDIAKLDLSRVELQPEHLVVVLVRTDASALDPVALELDSDVLFDTSPRS